MSTTMRNVLIVVIVLLVIALGVMAWFLFGPKLKLLFYPPPSTATSTPVSAATSTSPETPVHLVSGNQYYTADVVYPSSTPLSQSAGTVADTEAVALMKSAAQSAVSSFVQGAQLDNPPQGEINAMQGQKESITSSYQTYSGPEAISYVFSITENTLGAHPLTSYTTFTFDTKSGQELPLYDLFTPGADYLDAVASSSRAILTQQLGSNADPSMIDPGTSPTNINFQDFALDGSNLDIFFSPYQVAAYADGPQIVKIPLSQLSSILLQQYQ